MVNRFDLQQTIQQDQRFIMNMAMQHAFDVLQMPIYELSDWLEREIEKNPLLSISSIKKTHPSYIEETVSEQPTRYAYLEKEIREHFNTSIERKIAKFIGGSLDEKGFLTLSSDEICSSLDISKELFSKVLYSFQRMEIVGLGTQKAQEALLVQLEMKGKKDSLIYHIIKEYYSDLLHKSHRKITKLFKINDSDLKSLIYKELRPLNPFPGHIFLNTYNPPIIPDIIVDKVEDLWKIEVTNSDMPVFHIHEDYLEIENNHEDQEFMRRHIAKGKWLAFIVKRRSENLEQVVRYIINKQKKFLEGISDTPSPMTMQEIAIKLNKSESTISRTIANKYMDCPLGMIKLRTIFTQAIHTKEGIFSNKRTKDILLKLINQEKTPLSDETLSNLLKAQGIPCARRTVTKYRKELKILSSNKRKLWK